MEILNAGKVDQCVSVQIVHLGHWVMAWFPNPRFLL